MGLDYMKEGESETLGDGTYVEKTTNGTVVHNGPQAKFIIKNTIMETWINSLENNKDATVIIANKKEMLLKDAILSKILDTCSDAWSIKKEDLLKTLKTIFLTPRYPSVISNPTLNNSSEQCQACAEFYAKRNGISLEQLLYAIEAFHCSGRYLGHPYIELYADGSGKVVGRYGDELFAFRNLKELVSRSSDMMKAMEPEVKSDDRQLDFFE